VPLRQLHGRWARDENVSHTEKETSDWVNEKTARIKKGKKANVSMNKRRGDVA
jgi:hypothetical protein